MHICYFDEAGCVGKLPSANSNVAPVLVIVGLAFDSRHLRSITLEFLKLKRKYFSGLKTESDLHLSWIKTEIKGSEVRKHIASTGRNQRRAKERFLEEILDLLRRKEARIWGRVWIKGVGADFNGVAVYSSSVQSIYGTFQKYLTEKNDYGCVIGDSREAQQNSKVAHSIFTKKYSVAGDEFDRIVELPSFAHSENTVGIQLTDLIGSGILFPMAIETYCRDHVNSVHVRPGYKNLKTKFAEKIRGLQFRYYDEAGTGRLKGGIVVSDAISRRPGSHLFSSPPNPMTNTARLVSATGKKL